MADQHGYDMGHIRHIHFIGIGGAGMSGIAEVLHNLGYDISGSDLCENKQIKYMRNLGINIVQGHDAEHINGSDVVVVSSAVPDDNPEYQAARLKHIPVIPRAEMLAELMRFRYGIAIAGTHGKTTTTSLVASILTEGGLDPTYVIGGLLNSSGTHAALGTSKYLVAEADESDASFLHLQPVMAILTNIDNDHLGTYNGEYKKLRNNFLEFLQHLPFYGLAVICMDDENIRAIRNDVLKPVVTYGLDCDADYTAQIARQEKCKSWFSVSKRNNKDFLQVELNLPGKHNVSNALAAIVVACELGVSDSAIRKALMDFQGISRRSQILGEIMIGDKQALLIDDYAHHPSEIEATVSAVKSGWPDRRLLVIFQPHRYSRTFELFDDFVHVLSSVDVLFLLDIYPAGEKPIHGVDTKSMCRAMRVRGHVDPVYIENKNEISGLLGNVLTAGDIVLTLGAGDIGSLAQDLISEFGINKPGNG